MKTWLLPAPALKAYLAGMREGYALSGSMAEESLNYRCGICRGNNYMYVCKCSKQAFWEISPCTLSRCWETSLIFNWISLSLSCLKRLGLQNNLSLTIATSSIHRLLHGKILVTDPAFRNRKLFSCTRGLFRYSPRLAHSLQILFDAQSPVLWHSVVVCSSWSVHDNKEHAMLRKQKKKQLIYVYIYICNCEVELGYNEVASKGKNAIFCRCSSKRYSYKD